MSRRRILEILAAGEFTLKELAHHVGEPMKQVEEDLEHLVRSTRSDSVRIHVTPAVCNKCGFVFKKDKMSRPGKCPECQSTWITPPRIGLVTRE